MDDGLSGIAADVATYSWTVMRVSADGPGPDFAYSIGRVRTLGHPEILLAGLPLDTAHRLINDVGASVKAGHRYRAGETSDVVSGRLLGHVSDGAVTSVQRLLGLGASVLWRRDIPRSAVRLSRSPPPSAVWEEGAAADVRASQPGARQ